MFGDARRSISARLMMEIAWMDSMIGVALLVVEIAADWPVAVTTMALSVASFGVVADCAWATVDVPHMRRAVSKDRLRMTISLRTV